MDRPNDGVHGGTQSTAQAGKTSFERPAPRLQKKRSNPNFRNAAQGASRSSAGQAALAPGANSAGGASAEGGKQRRGSVRNTMRKWFGRRSREVEPQRTSPPRHTYHSSEPGPLATQPEHPEDMPETIDPVPPPIFDPLRSAPAAEFPRISSPAGGAFPNSGILKPMDLRGPPIRRRKTLPNVPSAAAQAAAASSSSRVPPLPTPTHSRNASASFKPPARAKSTKEEKRRSRSAGDLRTSLASEKSQPRNRNDEIRYWRESFQPDVLRASGFVTQRPPSQEPLTEPREERTSVAKGKQSFDTAILARTATLDDSPPSQSGLQPGDLDALRPSSGIGTDMSRDLEDRVAKLEAGLNTFQRSLQRLTADRNRRTVVVGGEPSGRRSTDDTRTPSMLADTLQGPFEYSSYEYEYGYNTRRPTTSPVPPPQQRSANQTPRALEDPFVDSDVQLDDDRDSRSRALGARAPPPPITITTSSPSPDYTFRSLYQMLNDERSARRRLEAQLRGLRQEMTDLSTHVATSSSNFPSQRNSYIHSDGTSGNFGSSAALRALLRETELASSPPATARPIPPHVEGGLQRDSHSSTAASTGAGAVVSRFSGSESEAGVEDVYTEDEELQTPMEAYRTPKESGSRVWEGGEVDMF